MAGRFLANRRILVDVVWVAGGQLLVATGALASIRLMTELLPPEEFGSLTLLVGIAALALGVSVSPRLQSIIRYYPDWRIGGRIGELRRVGARSLVFPTSLVALAIAGGWVIAVPSSGGAWYAGLLIAALLVTDGYRSFELVLFGAARRQRIAAVIYAADAWARPISALVAVLVLGASANAALGGYIVGAALVVVLLNLTASREGKEEPPPHEVYRGLGHVDKALGSDVASGLELAAAIRRYALPLIPLALFAWVSNVGDRYLIGGFLGLEEVGIYAAVHALVSRPFLMLSVVAELTFRPMLQDAISVGDRPLIRRAKLGFLLVVAGGGLAGVLSFILLGEWLAGLILAAEYRAAVVLIPWIAVGYAFYITSTVFSRYCYVFDDTKAPLLLTVAGTAIGVMTTIPAVMWFGVQGAAVALPLRFATELVLSILLAKRAERAFYISDRGPC